MKYLAIVCFLCLPLQSSAQYMIIHNSGGVKTKIALADIAKLTFDVSGSAVALKDQSFKVQQKLKMAMANILPNPFKPRVEYTLEKASAVRIVVFDMQGKNVRTVQQGIIQSGKHSIHWDLCNDSGAKVNTGPYILSVHVGENTISKNLFIVQ